MREGRLYARVVSAFLYASLAMILASFAAYSSHRALSEHVARVGIVVLALAPLGGLLSLAAAYYRRRDSRGLAVVLAVIAILVLNMVGLLVGG